jgi:hypothetical protein
MMSRIGALPQDVKSQTYDMQSDKLTKTCVRSLLDLVYPVIIKPCSGSGLVLKLAIDLNGANIYAKGNWA